MSTDHSPMHALVVLALAALAALALVSSCARLGLVRPQGDAGGTGGGTDAEADTGADADGDGDRDADSEQDGDVSADSDRNPDFDGFDGDPEECYLAVGPSTWDFLEGAYDLTISGSGYRDFEGLQVFTSVSTNPDDGRRDFGAAYIADGAFSIRRRGVLEAGDSYRVAMFIDADGDRLCEQNAEESEHVQVLTFPGFTGDRPATFDYAPVARTDLCAAPATAPFQIPGDANLDGCVDYYDFEVLQSDYYGSGPRLRSDFDRDESVGMLDFGILNVNYCRCW